MTQPTFENYLISCFSVGDYFDRFVHRDGQAMLEIMIGRFELSRILTQWHNYYLEMCVYFFARRIDTDFTDVGIK